MAGPKDVIICVVRGGGLRRAQRAAEKEFPITLCFGPLAGVVPYGPVTFMQKSFVVPAGPWRETRHVEHFGSKVKGDVLPPRRVESGFPIGIPMCLRGEALMIEYPGFKWNEQRSTGVYVAPGPVMEKMIGRESLRKRECSDRKFDEARGPINSGAEFPL